MSDKFSKTSPPPWSWSAPSSVNSTRTSREEPSLHTGTNKVAEQNAHAPSPKSTQHATVQGYVGKGILLTGQVSFSSVLRVEGVIRGDLSGGRLVVLLGGALVEGDISADEVVILDARVKGNILAQKLIELAPEAEVNGDVEAPRVNIRQGAVLHGECRLMPIGS